MIFLKTLPRMHKKVPGISLMIAFLTSMLVLALALVTLASIVRSFERTVGIERGNKVFFAAESGIEAAFYHKNSRQSSVHFDWEAWSDGASGICGDDDTSGTCPTELKTVEIQQTGTGATTRWKLLSRFVPEDGPDPDSIISGEELVYRGILGEFENVEIPLYYDSANNPAASPGSGIIPPGNVTVFIDRVYDQGSDSWEDSFPETINTEDFNFGDSRPLNNDPAADSLTLQTQRREEIVIDWSVSRNNIDDSRIQTFSAHRNIGVPCRAKDGITDPDYLLCETDIREDRNLSIILDDNGIPGDVRPCTTPTRCTRNLNEFTTYTNAEDTGKTIQDFRLTLQGLAPLIHDPISSATPATKVARIDYNIAIPIGTELPHPFYTIVSKVEQGDYQKEITLTVNEATSIGAFSYVIFE